MSLQICYFQTFCTFTFGTLSTFWCQLLTVTEYFYIALLCSTRTFPTTWRKMWTGREWGEKGWSETRALLERTGTETRVKRWETQVSFSPYTLPALYLTLQGSCLRSPPSLCLSTRGVKSTQFLYLIKSINTAIEIYSVTSKSLEFKISKSREVLVSKCT